MPSKHNIESEKKERGKERERERAAGWVGKDVSVRSF